MRKREERAGIDVNDKKQERKFGTRRGQRIEKEGRRGEGRDVNNKQEAEGGEL